MIALASSERIAALDQALFIAMDEFTKTLILVLFAIFAPLVLMIIYFHMFDEDVEEYRRLNLRGLEELEQGHHSRALQAFDRALEMEPSYEVSWNNKALVYLKKKDYPTALKYFNEAIRCEKNYYNALSGKGLCLFHLGRYAEAVNAFERSLRINPRFEKTWNNLGLTLVKMGMYDKAVEAYDRAIRLNRGYKGARENRALALKKLRMAHGDEPLGHRAGQGRTTRR